MRYELKKISLWAFIKVSFFVNLIIGFIVGVIYALFFGFFLAVMKNFPYMPDQGIEPPPDAPFGIIMVILPFFFAIIGGFMYTIMGIIFVFIYNLVAKITGGIEFNMEKLVEIAPVAPTAYAQTATPQYETPPPPPPPVERPPAPPHSEQRPQAPGEQSGKPPDDDDDLPTPSMGG